MSYDLYVWHEPAPITVNVADAKVHRWVSGDAEVFAPHPAVSAVREALLERYPPLESLGDEELDTVGVWSMTPAASDSVLVASCRWPFAAEVGVAVRGLAAAHGLVCYEPGGRVLDPGADGSPGFTLTGMTFPPVADPDAATLERAARTLSADNFYALLERADGHYAQVGYGRKAGCAPGVYALEHRAGPGGEHLRADTRDLVEVVRFLQEFRTCDDQWKRRHTWHALTL